MVATCRIHDFMYTKIRTTMVAITLATAHAFMCMKVHVPIGGSCCKPLKKDYVNYWILMWQELQAYLSDSKNTTYGLSKLYALY